MILDSKIIQSETTNDPIRIIAVQERTCFGISHMIHKALGNLFDVSLLKSSVFLILALAHLCYAIAWMTPYMYMPSKCNE